MNLSRRQFVKSVAAVPNLAEAKATGRSLHVVSAVAARQLIHAVSHKVLAGSRQQLEASFCKYFGHDNIGVCTYKSSLLGIDCDKSKDLCKMMYRDEFSVFDDPTHWRNPKHIEPYYGFADVGMVILDSSCVVSGILNKVVS